MSVMREFFRRLLWDGLLAADHVRARLGSMILAPLPRVRSRLDCSDPNRTSRKVALYVTYDRHGRIHGYVAEQVAALSRIGFRVIFITSSPSLTAEEVAKVAPQVWLILHRHNIGHDFGSYHDGVHELAALPTVDSLILMNDSCYGPFGELAEVEARARATGADMVGITDSWAHNYHLQSYFLWLDGALAKSAAFAQFWPTLQPYQPRSVVIRAGEIAFTQTMLRSGFSAVALYPYFDVALVALQRARERLRDEVALLPVERDYYHRLTEAISRCETMNPTHSFWDVLILHYRVPFIKRDLLRRNPLRIPGLVEWGRLVEQTYGVDADLIFDHLKLS